ncbi:hypothetical protein LTR28_001428 [Elasticomyces elasticus]|nr:hypothetical protein LTR28_001428 [Elasticomyces elasticus]
MPMMDVPQVHSTPTLGSGTAPTPSPFRQGCRAPANIKTPSLARSSTSTFDSPPSNILRRKPSSNDMYAANIHTESVISQDYIYEALKDPFAGSILGMSLPPISVPVRSPQTTYEQKERPSFDLARSYILNEASLPPQPHHASSATPSSRYSGSPGVFSNTSTPTSMSSYSPGIYASGRSLSRAKQVSPTKNRSPETWRKATPDQVPVPPKRQGLGTERESLLPSASTVKAGDGQMTAMVGREKRLPDPPAGDSKRKSSVPRHTPSDNERDILRKDSPMIGVSPDKTSRFGFFSRRATPQPTDAPPQRPGRRAKRGPAAGTGHEGYGRFGLGLRGRSGSSISGSNSDRSPSADSTTGSVGKSTISRKSSRGSQASSGLDESLRNRSTHVAMLEKSSRGTGQESSERGQKRRSSIATPPLLSTHPALKQGSGPVLLPFALPHVARSTSPKKRPALGHHKPFGTGENETASHAPDLATGKSVQRSLPYDGKPGQMPIPARTTSQSPAPSLISSATSKSTILHTHGIVPDAKRYSEGNRSKTKQRTIQLKSSSKWNFFQRAHLSQREGKEVVVELGEDSLMTAHQAPYQHLAHYVMIDNAAPVDLADVERMIREIDGSSEAASPVDKEEAQERRDKNILPERRQTSLLAPQPPTVEKPPKTPRPIPPQVLVHLDSSESPEVLRAQTASSTKAPLLVDIPKSSSPSQPTNPHKSRLYPVGRIPRVVSNRDRDRRMPDQSFSRPFVRTQPKPSVQPPGLLYTQIRELANPIESLPASSTTIASDVDFDEHIPSLSTDCTSVSVEERPKQDRAPGSEFLAFSPRQNSELSFTSSSGIASFPTSAAAQPAAVYPQHDDDVWHEYNDLMDDVMLSKPTFSTGTSLGVPLLYADAVDEHADGATRSLAQQVPELPAKPQHLRTSDPASLLDSQIAPAAATAAQDGSPFLQPLVGRNSPYSISHYLANYGDPMTSRAGSFGHRNLPSVQRDITTSARMSLPPSRRSRVSTHSRSASVPETVTQAITIPPPKSVFNDAQLMGVEEASTECYTSMANLRFGALMTSKWLSFGRILFSPAHLEMKNPAEDRILVLDGLGKDWSHYCALSYPSATVYNLGPTSAPSDPTSARADASWQPLPNHRHIHHAAPHAPFPFPRGFFAAVVFRFPRAASDAAYHACIFECKRVLRPGGYLEISALDLDLMNMGNRARKAVRALKVGMQQRDRDVSLRNVGDVMMRLVGRRGFEGVQRCVVGVPAAGRIPTSQDFSSIGSSAAAEAAVRGEHHLACEEAVERDMDFTDLLLGSNGSGAVREGQQQQQWRQNNDEGITKMVAKVGRWWYSTCYESALPGQPSIWADAALSKECERLGTSFRLLICYAQKPMCAKRRTVSV